MSSCILMCHICLQHSTDTSTRKAASSGFYVIFAVIQYYLFDFRGMAPQPHGLLWYHWPLRKGLQWSSMGLGGRCNGLQTKWLVDHVGMERLWLPNNKYLLLRGEEKKRSLNFPSCPVSDRKCRHVLNIRYSLRGVSALAPVKTSIIELLLLRNWMRYV